MAIDDVTTNYFGKTRWPYPRRYHAKVIDRIAPTTRARSRSTSSSRSRRTVADDSALLDSVANAGESSSRRRRRFRTGRRGSSVATTRCARSAPSPRAAFSRPTPPGVIRKVKYSVNGLKSLAVVTVETATGHPVHPAPSGRTARGSTTPARRGTLHALLVLERLQRTRPLERLQGQDRGHRPRCAAAAGHPADARRPADAGRRDPVERDRDRPAGRAAEKLSRRRSRSS